MQQGQQMLAFLLSSSQRLNETLACCPGFRHFYLPLHFLAEISLHKK